MTYTAYELTDAYKNIMMLLEEADEENEEMLLQALENVKEEIPDKADAYKIIMDRLDANIEMCKVNEKRIYANRKYFENKKDQLKQRLQNLMIETDMRDIKTDKFRFKIQNNPVSLRVLDETKVPEEFKKVEVKVDNTKLKDAIKNGLEVDYAELVQTESLRIR